MDKNKEYLETAIDAAVRKKEKARVSWLNDSTNPEKFLKLHEAHMEYKRIAEQWLSTKLVK